MEEPLSVAQSRMQKKLQKTRSGSGRAADSRTWGKSGPLDDSFFSPRVTFNALHGANNNLKFERIFSKAPVWLLQFHWRRMGCKTTGLQTSRKLAGAPELGSEARRERNRWPFLPKGTNRCRRALFGSGRTMGKNYRAFRHEKDRRLMASTGSGGSMGQCLSSISPSMSKRLPSGVPGFGIIIAGNLLEYPVTVSLGPNGPYIHLHHTVSASRRSLSGLCQRPLNRLRFALDDAKI